MPSVAERSPQGSQGAVTIHDIAQAAGVSPSTVSRVLTGSTPVAPAKREAVLDAVKRLNYQPNAFARGRAKGQSHSIGVLTQEINREFYGDILMGIEQALRGTDYHPVFASGSVLAEGAQAQALVSRNRVDAVIVVGGRMLEEELQALAERVPVVVLGRSVRGLESRCMQVDNFEGSYTATRYLIGLGHERIAHITGIPGHRHTVERIEGYRRALADAGLPQDPDLVVNGVYEEASGYRAAEQLLDTGVEFTAIFAAADLMAMGARLALHRRGLAVPEAVSLVGFDDHRLAEYMIPPLTTVRQPRSEMGAAAVEAVLSVLCGETLSLPSFRVELIIRDSAGPRRA